MERPNTGLSWVTKSESEFSERKEDMFLEKAEEPEIKLPTFAGSSEKQESYRKLYFYFSIYFCFIDYDKDFVWITIIRGHLTCLLRNLYAGQESNS